VVKYGTGKEGREHGKGLGRWKILTYPPHLSLTTTVCIKIGGGKVKKREQHKIKPRREGRKSGPLLEKERKGFGVGQGWKSIVIPERR